MLTVFLRAAILYALMVLVLRAMASGQMAGLQPFELATTIVIADLISTPMGEVSTPLLHGSVARGGALCDAGNHERAVREIR